MIERQKPDVVQMLDPANRDDVNGVLALQMKYFPMPDDTGLRRDLLREYFFTSLVRDGLVRCIFGRKDGKIVSYIVYTPYPNTYQKDGRRRHRLQIYWLTLSGLLRHPNRLAGVKKLLRRHRGEAQGKRPAVYDPGMADVLFLATVSPYGKWVPPGGSSRLTVRLFEEAVKDLSGLGITEIFMTVRSSNHPSIRYCHALGCYRVEEVSDTQGEPWTHFYYRIHGHPAGEA